MEFSIPKSPAAPRATEVCAGLSVHKVDSFPALRLNGSSLGRGFLILGNMKPTGLGPFQELGLLIWSVCAAVRVISVSLEQFPLYYFHFPLQQKQRKHNLPHRLL